MPAIEIAVDQSAIAAHRGSMRRLQRGVNDFRPMFRNVRAGVQRYIRDKFRKAGWNPWGTERWTALAPATVEARARGKAGRSRSHYARPSTEGPKRRQLRWTNALMDSLTGKEHSFSVITQGSMEIGSALLVGGKWPLAAIHHFGTKRAGRGHKTVIPPRPIWEPRVNFAMTVMEAGHYIDALITDTLADYRLSGRRVYLDPRVAKNQGLL